MRHNYRHAVRAWIHDQLQAAGVDYRSHYQDYGGTTRELYAGSLHLRLLDIAALRGQDLATAPQAVSLPLHSGTGHTTYWTRDEQRDVARFAARLYSEAVQAIDVMWEQVQASAALMLDTTRTLADRTAAWETVQRLHLPRGVPSLPARRVNVEAAVATIRARVLPPETDLAAYRGVHADRLRAFGEARLRWLLGPAAPGRRARSMAHAGHARPPRDRGPRAHRARGLLGPHRAPRERRARREHRHRPPGARLAEQRPGRRGDRRGHRPERLRAAAHPHHRADAGRRGAQTDPMSPAAAALAASLTLADLQSEPPRPSCFIPVERCEETMISPGIIMETCTTFMVPCHEARDLRMART